MLSTRVSRSIIDGQSIWMVLTDLQDPSRVKFVEYQCPDVTTICKFLSRTWRWMMWGDPPVGLQYRRGGRHPRIYIPRSKWCVTVPGLRRSLGLWYGIMTFKNGRVCANTPQGNLRKVRDHRVLIRPSSLAVAWYTALTYTKTKMLNAAKWVLRCPTRINAVMTVVR